MQLNRSTKILLGLGTLWITIYPLLFFAVWLLSVLTGMGFLVDVPVQSEPPLFMLPFLIVFPLHCLTILLQLGLMAFYLIHVIKNTRAVETAKIILGIGIFFMPFVAMPVYFYLYIWLDTPPARAARP